MSLELFREINSYLPLIAFGFLSFRTVQAWNAEWAKPDHTWHYRAVLVVLNLYTVSTTLGTWASIARGNAPTIITPMFTISTVGVLLICWFWPPDRKVSP